VALHKETSLQISIIKFLKMALPHGWRAVAIPNGGKRGPFEAKLLKDMGALAGFPDLMILGQLHKQPRAWFVEVKVPEKYSRLSDAQKDCHDWMQDIGFKPGVVRSIDDVYEFGLAHEWPWKIKLGAKHGRNATP
jgi:hypothetical protein